MAQFVPFAQGVEVNGRTVLSIVDGMGVFKRQALKILQDCGIGDPRPDGWYSQAAWLKGFELIAERVGEATLFNIGKSIPKNAAFPDGINSLGKALAAIDVAYHANHRGGEIGKYQLIRAEERAAKMICENPYPCDFDRGIITAMTDRFTPKGCSHKARVSHDVEGGCRKDGGDACVYWVRW